jgi:hypothetical protein
MLLKLCDYPSGTSSLQFIICTQCVYGYLSVSIFVIL